MWSPTTTSAVVVVAGIVVVVVVVVGAAVVVVAGMVVVVGIVVAIVGAKVGAASAPPPRASCHCDSTYDKTPPAINAVTTSRTMPTLRFDRPACNASPPRSGSGGSHVCDMFG